MYSINVQELTKHLTCALTLIRTFGCNNKNQVKLMVVKMEFIIKMQGVIWNPGGEMKLASDWFGIRNGVLGSPGLFSMLIGVLSLTVASLCTSASLFLLSKLAISDTCTSRVYMVAHSSEVHVLAGVNAWKDCLSYSFPLSLSHLPSFPPPSLQYYWGRHSDWPSLGGP